MAEINNAESRAVGPLESKLRAIYSSRWRYSDAEVNFIRESYLLDGMSIPWIIERLHQKSSENSIWRIAVGRSYTKVPLSPRLAAAHEEAQRRRASPGVEPEPAAAAEDAPGRAEELLEEIAEDWG